jgi:thioredoxin 1
MMTLQKGNLTYTSDANFENDVLKSELPVFVDFYADWCGPCRTIEPIMEDLSEEYYGKVRFVKVDVDTTPQTAANYGVMSIPTLIVFRGGKEVKRLVGAASRDHYVREIQRVLQS